MRITHHKFGKLVSTLVILLTAALVIVSATSALAKGAQRSPSGDSRGGGQSESRQSESRQSNQPSDRSETRSDTRYESPSNNRSGSQSESRPEPKPEPRYEPRNDNPPPSVSQRSSGSSNNSDSGNQGYNAPLRHKGSDESRSSSRDSGSSSSGSTQQNSNQTPPTTYRYNPPSDSRSTGESSSRDTRGDSRSGSQLSDRIGGRDEGRSDSNNTSAPTVRPSAPTASSRQPSAPTSTRGISTLGVYRKEHADLASIWKERRERRDTRSDNWVRYDNHNYGHGDKHNSGVHVNINLFPCVYKYYAYDYDPWRCYPSMYCYYGGLFPPFIHSTRVIVVHHSPVVYHYVDIPLSTVFYDSRYDNDDYYLANYRYRDLSSSLRDIERAWERSEPDLLTRHTRKSWRVDIFLKEDYAYTLNWEDFREMTEDAMDHIQTVDFEFYKIRQRDRDEVVAYAKHNYYDYDYYDVKHSRELHTGGVFTKEYKTVYVRYTLQRDDDEWYITEVGSAPYRL